jgi:hypothetical protein
MSKDKYVVVGRGKAGWHASLISGGNVCSSSGGTLEHYLADAQDEVFIYDASDAKYETFASFVFKGPMLDITLAPDEIDSFGDHKTLKSMLPGMSGGMETLGAMALTGLTSLDRVGINVYLKLLKSFVPKTKFGIVKNHKIVWDQ